MGHGKHFDELCNINGGSWAFGDIQALDNYAAWESTLLIGGALDYILDPFAATMSLFFGESANPSLMAV